MVEDGQVKAHQAALEVDHNLTALIRLEQEHQDKVIPQVILQSLFLQHRELVSAPVVVAPAAPEVMVMDFRLEQDQIQGLQQQEDLEVLDCHGLETAQLAQVVVAAEVQSHAVSLGVQVVQVEVVLAQAKVHLERELKPDNLLRFQTQAQVAEEEETFQHQDQAEMERMGL